jgi:predicted DNA-binding ribbon-helix-helix protein
MSRLENRNVVNAQGKRTSIRLEPEFWDALAEIAKQGGKSLGALVTEIDAKSPRVAGERTSEIRRFILKWYRRGPEPAYRLDSHDATECAALLDRLNPSPESCLSHVAAALLALANGEGPIVLDGEG